MEATHRLPGRAVEYLEPIELRVVKALNLRLALYSIDELEGSPLDHRRWYLYPYTLAVQGVGRG